MIPARTTEDITHWSTVRKPAKKAEQARSKALRGNKFSQLNPVQKDELLKNIALQLGLIDED